MHRVLLADDARLLAELEQTAFGRSDCELVVVRPDDDVVRLASELKPDVIVLRDGESCPDALQICRRLRQNARTAHVPVIYIGLGLERERYRQAGIDLFLPRPVRRHELREGMARMLPVRDRVALRRKVRLPVRWLETDRSFGGSTVNLSISGALLRLDQPVETGGAGILAFRAGRRALRLESRVVRQAGEERRESTVAVRFERLPADTAVYLSRFVRTIGERRGSGQMVNAEEGQHG